MQEILDEINEFVEQRRLSVVSASNLCHTRLHIEIVSLTKVKDRSILGVHSHTTKFRIVLTLRADTNVNVNLFRLILNVLRFLLLDLTFGAARAIPRSTGDTAEIETAKVKSSITVVAKENVTIIVANVAVVGVHWYCRFADVTGIFDR